MNKISFSSSNHLLHFPRMVPETWPTDPSWLKFTLDNGGLTFGCTVTREALPPLRTSSLRPWESVPRIGALLKTVSAILIYTQGGEPWSCGPHFPSCIFLYFCATCPLSLMCINDNLPMPALALFWGHSCRRRRGFGCLESWHCSVVSFRP